MRMSLHTDYALRMLIFLAAREDAAHTVSDVAAAYGLSRNHLAKIAQTLRDHGVVETARGRGGGLKLRKRPDDINIGDLVRATEEDFALAECMQSHGGTCCTIAGACGLRGMLGEALDAYFAVLRKYTLADVLHNRPVLRALLGGASAAA